MTLIHRSQIAAACAWLLIGAGLLGSTPLAAQTPTPDPARGAGTAEAAPTSAPDAEGVYRLPFVWQGDATVTAAALAETAPPLQAEPTAGDFTISYLPTPQGDILRILPAANDTLGSLQIVWRLDATGAQPPLPTGSTLSLALAVRLYAPVGTARAFIADDRGSSSAALAGLNWTEVTVNRAVSAGAGEVHIGIEWRDVPRTAWLEVRDLRVAFTGGDAQPALAATDTPTPPGAATSAPPTFTPTPTAQAEPATPTPLATPTPDYIVVTATPTPVDVFEAATRVVMATAWATLLGAATATPANLATPTFTPSPIVVTHTPTPGNAATATHVALYATAVAVTTGTPTPLPADAVVLVATAPPPAAAAAQPNTPAQTPMRTPTPIFVLLDDVPTPAVQETPVLPPELVGKILFLADYRNNPRQPAAMVINPDGSDIGIMTSTTFYTRAVTRDSYSSDMRFRVYALREAGGAAHNSGRIQLFYDDALYQSTHHQLTYFGGGTAWAPVWSPARDLVAFVASESGNDEIWLVQPNGWPAAQVTQNEWEWDHHPSFSPDGRQIVFSSNRVNGQRQLWIMDSDGSNVRQLTYLPYEAWDPVWVKYPDS
jgi:hypothetical protein